jgi:hypothetical protein
VSIVVDILLLQTVSIAIASVGVLLGAIYYIFQIRHQTRIRKTDLLVRMYSTITSRDWLEAWDRVNSMEITDFSKMRAEHRIVDVNEVLGVFDELGVLLQMRLIDFDLVEKLFHGHVKRVWEKLKPVAEQGRKSANDPRLGEGVEYLYNEVKKREKAGAKSG